ncbi:syntaxin-6 isoform X2 [Athene noctua]|uniref:syntaxin-6 isoform X2 n=1 Tax=Athene noctua TaxID=126797 RepID=UPI003EB730BA
MKDQMSNSSMQALAERKNRQVLLGESGSQSWSTGPDKYSRLDRELHLANSHFIEEQQAQQQLIVEQQDEQLELVSGSIGVLKNMSQRIGGELEEQAVMLDDFSHELDSTQSRLDNVMKKLAKVSHMTSEIPGKKIRTQLSPFSSEDHGLAPPVSHLALGRGGGRLELPPLPVRRQPDLCSRSGAGQLGGGLTPALSPRAGRSWLQRSRAAGGRMRTRSIEPWGGRARGGGGIN